MNVTPLASLSPFLLPQDPKVTADRAYNGFGTNFENSPEPIYGAQVCFEKGEATRAGVGASMPKSRAIDSSQPTRGASTMDGAS